MTRIVLIALSFVFLSGCGSVAPVINAVQGCDKATDQTTCQAKSGCHWNAKENACKA